VAGVLGIERYAHGHRHLPTSSTRPGSRDLGAALLVHGLRLRAKAMCMDRVHADGDAGDHAPPGEAVQVAALLQGQHLHQRLRHRWSVDELPIELKHKDETSPCTSAL
jgi:hypothetical protein